MLPSDSLSQLIRHVQGVEQKTLIDEERSRIARDIHDGALQQIVHVMHKLEYIQQTCEKEPQMALRELAHVYTTLEGSLKDLRRSISSHLPLQLEELGFAAALQALVDEYALNEPRSVIDCDTNDANVLPSLLEVPVFRFIQEALNNVRKHAQAAHVAVRISALSGLLLVEVSDDGSGFLPKQSNRKAREAHHVGLRVMRERIEQAGGNVEVRSKLGEGTTLKARFPLMTPIAMLTKREREVLRLLVQGLTNRAIADTLSVSTETVKSHVHNIMQKMHVKDRTQAAVIATKQHWL